MCFGAAREVGAEHRVLLFTQHPAERDVRADRNDRQPDQHANWTRKRSPRDRYMPAKPIRSNPWIVYVRGHVAPSLAAGPSHLVAIFSSVTGLSPAA
jgi:hypothetical protein